MTYSELKSIQKKIIKKMYFKNKNKELSKIYNYCKGFCFEWERLKKYIKRQINLYKNKDQHYYEFMLLINNYIINEDIFNKMIKEIENKFWEVKNTFKQPIKKEFQIWLYADHVIKIEKKQFEWIFLIDNNHSINKKKFEQMVIPVKFSKYHKKKLDGRILQKTFTLKLNKYGRVEIIACYNIEINYKVPTPKDIIGIDIGLKKLITTSDGEIIKQNYKIVRLAKMLKQKQSNRDSLQNHLKEIKNDELYELPSKNYNKQKNKLTRFVICDNRYKIKQFLKSRLSDHIIMEDIKLRDTNTYHPETNYLIRSLNIQQIKNDIIKYCKELGIKISLINPAYTSQECSECGYVDKKNRKTQEKFCCVKCGHTDNADHNASVNIINRYYRNDINLKTPMWRIKEILNVI
jgi:putative transposase